MNDDPYGNLLPSSSVLPLPLALLLFLLFFVHKHHARLQGRNDACAAFKILEQLFGARFAGLRIFFDAEFFAPSRLSSPCGDKLQFKVPL